MRVLHGHSARVEKFVSEMIPRCADGFGPAYGVGIINEDGLLVAGMVFHGWDVPAQTIEFSGASITPKWMTRQVLHEVFSYAFDFLGCQMIMTRNSASNKRLHRQLKAFGFTRWDVPRLFGRTEDGVFWTLTDTDWRASPFYLKDMKHVEAKAADAALAH
jgi:RimJ/RimL family protein N-acetyltransferase